MTSRSQNAPGATRVARIGAVALATFAGASVWVSMGTQAVASPSTMERIAVLAPAWLLGGLALSGAVLAIAAKPSPIRLWPLSLTVLLWLPYLPGTIPAAFLMWQGPLEGLVWLAIVVGMVTQLVSIRRYVPERVASDPQQAPWLAAAALGVVALVAAVSVRDVIPGGDEPHYLVITQSLLRDGDLLIENNHTGGDYLSYFAGRLRPHFLTRGSNGQIYSIHSPGVSVLILPAFAVAGYAGAVVTVVSLAALVSALTWTTAWLLSGSVAGAWVGWAAVFLSSPFVFHAFTIYPDGPAALAVIAGVWLLVRAELGAGVSRAQLWAVSSGLSTLPWLHTRFAIVAGALGLCLLARIASGDDRRGRLTALLVIPTVAAAAWLSYFWVIWGTPNPAAPYGADTGSAIAYMGRGLTGLLVDQQFGLLATAPVYAIALAGVIALARLRRRLAVELAVVAVPYVLVTATYAMWWGGISAPARFLTAVLPLAALTIAAWWPRQSPAWRTITVFLLLVSVLMVWPRAFVDGGRLLYSDRSGFDLVLGWAAQAVDLPLAFPSVHRDRAAGALRDAGVWLLVGLAVAGAIRVFAGDRSRTVARRWTVVTMAASAGVMIGATAVWARHGGGVVTPSRSRIAALAALRHPWQPMFVRISPSGRLSADEFLGRAAFGTTDRTAPRAGDPTLLRASAVPAGDYEVWTAAGASTGDITMVLGRNDSPVERWPAAASPGQPVATLHLPVDVAALTIRGDGRGDAAAVDLRLRPTGVSRAANPDARPALRAARYGAARVFAFDDRAYLEPTGFWTRAEGTATLVIDRDDPGDTSGLQIAVRAGAVATSVDLSVGDWSIRLPLAAGQQEFVRLPPGHGARSWAVTIRSGAGFRPSAIDPASDDVRQLAVWVELP